MRWSASFYRAGEISGRGLRSAVAAARHAHGRAGSAADSRASQLRLPPSRLLFHDHLRRLTVGLADGCRSFRAACSGGLHTVRRCRLPALEVLLLTSMSSPPISPLASMSPLPGSLSKILVIAPGPARVPPRFTRKGFYIDEQAACRYAVPAQLTSMDACTACIGCISHRTGCRSAASFFDVVFRPRCAVVAGWHAYVMRACAPKSGLATTAHLARSKGHYTRWVGDSDTSAFPVDSFAHFLRIRSAGLWMPAGHAWWRMLPLFRYL